MVGEDSESLYRQTDRTRWPSITWQLFWSWVYAPILLWRVRKIHDVHGWRKQTVACVLAGLVTALSIGMLTDCHLVCLRRLCGWLLCMLRP
jgi:hypothetical protein